MLRSEYVFDDGVKTEGWVSGGEEGFHRVFDEVRKDSWILSPWWLPCDVGCRFK